MKKASAAEVDEHLVLPCGPFLAIISLPSSRFHVIFGFGNPLDLQTNLADPPSGTCESQSMDLTAPSSGPEVFCKPSCRRKSLRRWCQVGWPPLGKQSASSLDLCWPDRQELKYFPVFFKVAKLIPGTCIGLGPPSSHSWCWVSTCCSHCASPTVARYWWWRARGWPKWL